MTQATNPQLDLLFRFWNIAFVIRRTLRGAGAQSSAEADVATSKKEVADSRKQHFKLTDLAPESFGSNKCASHTFHPPGSMQVVLTVDQVPRSFMRAAWLSKHLLKHAAPSTVCLAPTVRRCCSPGTAYQLVCLL